MKQHYPEAAEAFILEVDMDYFRAANDTRGFAKACDDYAQKVAKGNAEILHKLAGEILTHFAADEKCMKQAEKYAKEAVEEMPSYDYYLTYANILLKNGKKKDALSAANKCLEFAKEKGADAERSAQMLIKIIEG
jgi:hypothetical protein